MGHRGSWPLLSQEAIILIAMTEPTVIDQFVQQLRTVPLFKELDEATLQELAKGASRREYQTNEMVVLEGEALPGLYYVEYGWLKVVKISPTGREQTLRFLEPGETFNEIGVFTDQANPATAIALEPAGIWMIRREALFRLLHNRPEFARHIIAKMAERMLYLVSLVTDLSLRPTIGRLARLLLEDASEGVLHRPRWYTQAELAARLGTVPDVIQRALRSLENDGLITVEKHQIRILDRQTLDEIAS